eukprot:m.304541 g.304541  ORF g.304541 m.304541 type:complete len:230 (+) comp20173_c0_seq11:679-1368(+)
MRSDGHVQCRKSNQGNQCFHIWRTNQITRQWKFLQGVAQWHVRRGYIARAGCASIPSVNPVRRMLCGMMSAVDDSLRNVTDAYKAMGLWETTVIIFSTDNGGNTDTGGNNAPLRGNKATTFEGGVRGVGWVGGGWTAVLRKATSRALIHVSDWYPTIVHGIAGLEVGIPADGTPALDGMSAWDAITTGSNSSRTEILLNLIPSGKSGNVPGEVLSRRKTLRRFWNPLSF